MRFFLRKNGEKIHFFIAFSAIFRDFCEIEKNSQVQNFWAFLWGDPVNIWGDHGQIMGDHGQIMGKSWAMLGFGGFSQLTAGFWWVFAAYGWVFRLACWVFLPYGWVFRLRNDKVNSLLLFGNPSKVPENIPLFGGPYRNSHR